MMKRFLCLLLIGMCALMAVSASAEVIPPEGMGQIGLQAVVLCENLSVRVLPNTRASRVTTLHWGRIFSVQTIENGWCDCFLSETDGSSGWVLQDYLKINPAWYRVEGSTYVYAWANRTAPKVGQVVTNDQFPILKGENGWLLISLRGAVGWIYDPTACEYFLSIDGLDYNGVGPDGNGNG